MMSSSGGSTAAATVHTTRQRAAAAAAAATSTAAATPATEANTDGNSAPVRAVPYRDPYWDPVVPAGEGRYNKKGEGDEEEEEDPAAMYDAWRAAMRPVALEPDAVLIPSKYIFLPTLLWPLMVWIALVGLGVHAFEGVVQRRREAHHVMVWFDVYIFRTIAGPMIPFVVLLLRALAAAPLPTLGQSTSRGPISSSNASGSPNPASRSRLRTWRAWLASATNAPAGAGTLLARCCLIYSAATVVRMLAYTAHLAAQANPTLLGTSKGLHRPGSGLMSDHILLGASVVACCQVELVCALSDFIKHTVVGASVWRLVHVSAAMLLSMAASACVALDMHYTARHFHEPMESLTALIAGAALFQVPLLIWIWYQREIGAETIRAAAAAAGLIQPAGRRNGDDE